MRCEVSLNLVVQLLQSSNESLSRDRVLRGTVVEECELRPQTAEQREQSRAPLSNDFTADAHLAHDIELTAYESRQLSALRIDGCTG
jgi:hypothetical protein